MATPVAPALPYGGDSTADNLLKRAFDQLEVWFKGQTPSAAFEYVDVVFPSAANTDTDIRHNLRANSPAEIRFQVVSADRAVAVYRDLTGTAKAWTSSVIYLKASVASAACRLLLTVER